MTFIVFAAALTGFASAQDDVWISSTLYANVSALADDGAWSRKANMPTARSAHSAGAVNGKIYAIGGYGGNDSQKTLSTVEEYDPVTDTWTTKAEMPTARWGHSGGVVNGKIYAIGGLTYLNEGFAEVYVYDPGGEPTWVDDMIPVGFDLVQNYPNPFNPATTIDYRLDKAGMVNLVIYDLLGRKVETLVDEIKTPGNYEVRWSAEGCASGVYFYRIEAGGSKVLTQKMMLVK